MGKQITKKEIATIAQEILEYNTHKRTIDDMPATKAYAIKIYASNQFNYTTVIKVTMMVAQDALMEIMADELVKAKCNASFTG